MNPRALAAAMLVTLPAHAAPGGQPVAEHTTRDGITATLMCDVPQCTAGVVQLAAPKAAPSHGTWALDARGGVTITIRGESMRMPAAAFHTVRPE